MGKCVAGSLVFCFDWYLYGVEFNVAVKMRACLRLLVRFLLSGSISESRAKLRIFLGIVCLNGEVGLGTATERRGREGVW